MTGSCAMSIIHVNRQRPDRKVMECQSYSMKRAKKKNDLNVKERVIFPVMVKFYYIF